MTHNPRPPRFPGRFSLQRSGDYGLSSVYYQLHGQGSESVTNVYPANYASGQWSVTAAHSWGVRSSGSIENLVGGSDPLTEQITFDLRFIFGASTKLEYGLRARADAFNGTSSADLAVNLRWNGLSSIGYTGTNLAGYGQIGTISSYSIVSESGLDYRTAVAPVPLPAAVWMFASVILGVLGFQRPKTA